MTLATRLPYSHPFAGGYPRIGGQPLPTDPDAIDYLQRQAAVDGPVEVGVAMAVDAFVKGCKADGIWSAIKASCIMAGARTISGALVPLKTPYGAELVDIDNLPTPTIYDFDGSVGAWDATSRTMSNTAQTAGNTGFPRFGFAISGISTSKRYRVTARITGDIAAVVQLRLATSGGTPVPYSDDGNGGRVFDGIITPTSANYVEFTINGYLAVPKSARIESLSIREDSFTPTPYNLTNFDYARTTGIKGDGSTTYLNSNRAENADGQNDAHMSVFVTAAAGSGQVNFIGSQFSWIAEDDVATYFRRNQASSASVASHANTGFLGVSRDAAADMDYRVSGVTDSLSQVSVAPSSGSIAVYRNYQSVQYNDARLAFYSIGSAIPNLAALDARVTNLVKGIQFWNYTGLSPHAYDPDTIAYVVAGYAAGGTL